MSSTGSTDGPDSTGSTSSPEGWAQGCAFPDGVVHDHGNALCHQATAVLTAQSAVMAFLMGIGQGQEISLCENTQCRVRMYRVGQGLGASDGWCPSCYGSPGVAQDPAV